MDLLAAEAMARELMEQHGVAAAGWRFVWSHGRRQLGSAHVRRLRKGRQIKTIRLSRHLVQLNSEAEVRDTILHEIAHAIAGIEHGHDATWKAVCVRIGATPQRLAGEDVQIVPPRYTIVCRQCERAIAHRYRRVNPRRLQHSYCRQCGPTSKGRLTVHDAAAMAPLGLFQQVA